jgi:hypothetical protein
LSNCWLLCRSSRHIQLTTTYQEQLRRCCGCEDMQVSHINSWLEEQLTWGLMFTSSAVPPEAPETWGHGMLELLWMLELRSRFLDEVIKTQKGKDAQALFGRGSLRTQVPDLLHHCSLNTAHLVWWYLWWPFAETGSPSYPKSLQLFFLISLRFLCQFFWLPRLANWPVCFTPWRSRAQKCALLAAVNASLLWSEHHGVLQQVRQYSVCKKHLADL